MTYEELKEVMAEFHAGNIDKRTLAFAIYLWQRKAGYTR